MKFMLMMQGTKAGWDSMSSWTQAEFKAHIEFMQGFAAMLAKAGELVLAEGLDLPMNAKIVKARAGQKPLVTDGPFPESKEFLAGFGIVDVVSAARAVEIAAAASAAPGPGGKPLGIPIEVRQVGAAPEV